LILGPLILAIKFNEDDYYSNEFYSKVGGVTNSEFNKLESESYSLLNHSLWIDDDLYDKYKVYLEQYKPNHNAKEYLDDWVFSLIIFFQNLKFKMWLMIAERSKRLLTKSVQPNHEKTLHRKIYI